MGGWGKGKLPKRRLILSDRGQTGYVEAVRPQEFDGELLLAPNRLKLTFLGDFRKSKIIFEKMFQKNKSFQIFKTSFFITVINSLINPSIQP